MFLSQIPLTTGEKSFDLNFSHFCVIYPLCTPCVKTFIVFPELPLVGLNVIFCRQCRCYLLIGAAVNHLHSVLVAKLISISLRGCVDSLFGFQQWSSCSQLALSLSLCLYFRPCLYVATPPPQLYFTNSNFGRILLSNVTFCVYIFEAHLNLTRFDSLS